MTVSELFSDVASLMRDVATELSGLGYTFNPSRETFHQYVIRAYNGLASASLSPRRVSFADALTLLANQQGASDTAARRSLDGLIADLLNELQSGDGGGGGGDFLLKEDGSGHYQLEDGSGSILTDVYLVGGIAASENSSTPNGSRWFFGDTFNVGNAASVLATGHVTETTPAHHAAFTITDVYLGDANSITAVTTGASGTLRVAGDKTRGLFVGAKFLVASSTGNNGTYTVASAVFSGGNTTVTVTGSVPNATADGLIGSLPFITVAGDHVADLVVATSGCLRISGSTGNDDLYTSLRDGVLVSGSTYVQVNSGLADPTIDGTFLVGGAISTYVIDTPGDGYVVASGIPLHATGGSAGTGADLNVTAVA